MEECGKSKNKCKCLSIVFGVLTALFLGVIGTIIGTVFAETILAALSAVIVLAIKNSAQNVSLCAESFYECLFQDLSMLWCSFGHEWAFPLFLYHQALLFVIFLLMNFDYAMFPSFDRRRLFSALRYHLHILTIIV